MCQQVPLEGTKQSADFLVSLHTSSADDDLYEQGREMAKEGEKG